MSITVFPNSGGRGIKYLWKEYLGLDRKTIYKLKQLKSRFITIHKHYPMTYISEHECGLLTALENDF
jgi:hypothetical protein